MSDKPPPLLFALSGSDDLGAGIARHLGLSLSPHEARVFEDGEHKARPLVGVRARDVYVIHSLYSEAEESVNDKLCRLLFFLGALRDGGAERICAVIPYLAYARKDRRTKPHDPLTSRYMAQLIEAMGADLVMVMDVHNIAAFENGFRCPTVHLDTRSLFAQRICDRFGDRPLAVVSPDIGGVKRAQLFQEMLEQMIGHTVGKAILEKRRSQDVVSGSLFAGDVKGATVLVIDDLISSGGTMARAAHACRDHGAQEVYAVAAHGLFVGRAAKVISDPALSGTFVTDSVRPFRLGPKVIDQHLEIVSAAPLLAEAIRRCHTGGSVSDLLGGSS